jgi:hypothetical protein
VAETRFHGVIGSRDAGWLWPDSRLVGGAWTRGVPVDIEVGESGLVVSPRTRLLRGERWSPVTLAWSELAGAYSKSRGHTGRTGGLTLRETFEVTLHVVGSRASGFELPAGVPELLPGFPAGADLVGRAGYAPLMVTMPDGDALAAEVTARASGRPA